MEETKLHPSLKVLLPMLKGISNILGTRYEVILHDLSHVESSIIGIEGNITNRSIGGPATNFLLSVLKQYGNDAPDTFHYKSTTSDGRTLRSSTIFIRDKGKIIGCLCVNQDLTDYYVSSKLLQELTATGNDVACGNEKETFARDISEVMETIVSKELELFNKPVAYMQKEDKLTIVHKLEDKGIFDVKGSVEYIADRLGVTNFTIYNYLKEIRFVKN